MIGIGTIVNAVAIILGGLLGVLIKNGLPEKYKSTIMQALGLSVLFIGASGVLQGIFKVGNNGSLQREYIMTMILSLVIGGVIGELLDIENKLQKTGDWLQKKFAFRGNSFAEGFVTASLVYCVGAMAIVGSLEDGLAGNPATLFAKSILDGISAVIFSATLGIGVAFSSIPILIYQGGITLLAGYVKPWLTPSVISQMSLIGGVLITGIGLNILEIKKVKVGNLLPSVFMPLIYFIIKDFIK